MEFSLFRDRGYSGCPGTARSPSHNRPRANRGPCTRFPHFLPANEVGLVAKLANQARGDCRGVGVFGSVSCRAELVLSTLELDEIGWRIGDPASSLNSRGSFRLMVETQELARLQRKLGVCTAGLVRELHFAGAIQKLHHGADLPSDEAVLRQIGEQRYNI